MSRIKTIAIAIAALMTLTAGAQNTTKLTASKANDFGLVYSLPITVFDIVVETEFTEWQPGEFYNYAQRYLSRADAIINPKKATHIKSVTLVPRGIPDKNNRWMVELKGASIAYMMLNASDVPIAINTEQAPPEETYTLPVARPAAPTALETEAAGHAITQEMASCTSQSRRAYLASQRIYDLREIRNDLISGTAENMPPDGLSLQLALDNLSAQEAALSAMFLGTVKKWTEISVLTFTPDSTDVNNQILARLSATKGIVSPDDLSGMPVYIDMKVTSNGQLPVDPAGQPRKAPKDGIAYNIPGTATITVTCNGEQLTTGSFDIAQIGKKFYLDPKLFTDKKSPAFVIFNSITGGITTLGTTTPK